LKIRIIFSEKCAQDTAGERILTILTPHDASRVWKCAKMAYCCDFTL